MPFLFELARLSGYHQVIAGGIRRGIGADVLYRELNRLGAGVPRRYIREFAREVKRQIEDQGAIRRNWANRSIDRSLYAPVDISSRFDYYYNVDVTVSLRETGAQGVVGTTIGSFRELNVGQIEAQAIAAAEQIAESLNVVFTGLELMSAQRRVGI